MPTGSLIGALNPLKTKTSIPEQLFLPTYQNRLRLVGRHLDVNEFKSACILDVEGGILVRALGSRMHTPELLEFPDDAFKEMVRSAIQSRGRRKRIRTKSVILPTGYEDLLRALGYELDQRMAKSITVYETQETLFGAGLAAGDNSTGSFSPFDFVLSAEDIQEMLDAAFKRRA
jgi:hypothetical protein